MASIINRPGGHKWVQFLFDGKHKTIRLGVTSKSKAALFKRGVEDLVSSKHLGDLPEPRTVKWLSELSETLYGRLVAVGLAKPREKKTITDLLTKFRASLSSKESTLTTVDQAIRNVGDFFTGDASVGTITEAGAEEFKAWLACDGRHGGGRLASATVSRRVRRARQIFEFAVKSRWLASNPFAAVKGRGESNRARDFYVVDELVDRILAATQDAEFRLIVALARYGGLRCPSEVLALRWSAVNWAEDRLIIKSPKTERHVEHEDRLIPLFAEIRPYLDDLWDSVDDGADLMFPGHQVTGTALTKKLRAICNGLGIKLWKKPWNNMRATRDTELRNIYPAHVGVAWLGHSEEIARRHYLQIGQEHWDAAACGPSAGGPEAKSEAP